MGSLKNETFCTFSPNFFVISSILCHMTTCPFEDNSPICVSLQSHLSLYSFPHADQNLLISSLLFWSSFLLKTFVVSASEDTRDSLYHTWVPFISKPLCSYSSEGCRNGSMWLFFMVLFLDTFPLLMDCKIEDFCVIRVFTGVDL